MLTNKKILIAVGILGRIIQYVVFSIMCFLILTIQLALFIACIVREPPAPTSGVDFSTEKGVFEIYTCGNNRRMLLMNTPKRSSLMLLEYITSYKSTDSKLYVVSEKEGYAVADLNTNICRIYILEPETFYIWYLPNMPWKFIEHENIQYLNSFFEFSDEEQIMLRYLQE